MIVLSDFTNRQTDEELYLRLFLRILLDTMINVFCRIFEVIAAKRFNIIHNIWFKNAEIHVNET